MKGMKRIGTLLACFLISATGTIAAPAVSGPPVEISAIEPLTGTGAFIGASHAQTLKLIEATVNAENGIGGRPLKFVIYDNQSSAQIDVQLAQTLIAKNVPVVIDGGPASSCHASAPLFVNGPVMFCLSPAFYPPKDGYEFAANATSRDGMIALLAFMRDRGLKRIAVLNMTDTAGQEADEALRELLALPENHDLTVTAWEHFAPNDMSVAAQVAKIKASNPQAILPWVSGTPDGLVLRSLSEAGLDVPVFQSNANQIYAQLQQYRDFLPRRYYIWSSLFTAFPDTSMPEMRPVLTKFYGAFAAAGVRPDLGAMMSWDPAMIVVEALRKLGPGAGAKDIRNFIGGLHDYVGANGIYDFRTGNQRGLDTRDVIIVEWNSNAGTWTPVSSPGGKPLRQKNR